VKYLLLLMAFISLGLTACKEPNDPPKPKAPAQAQTQETVFDDLVNTKARAKQQTDQATEKSRTNLEEAMKKNDVTVE
jgi:hypothetical protein